MKKYMKGYKFKLLTDSMCYNDAFEIGARAAYHADYYGRVEGSHHGRKWTYRLLWLEDRRAANLWRERTDGIKEEVGVFYLAT